MHSCSGRRWSEKECFLTSVARRDYVSQPYNKAHTNARIAHTSLCKQFNFTLFPKMLQICECQPTPRYSWINNFLNAPIILYHTSKESLVSRNRLTKQVQDPVSLAWAHYICPVQIAYRILRWERIYCTTGSLSSNMPMSSAYSSSLNLPSGSNSTARSGYPFMAGRNTSSITYLYKRGKIGYPSRTPE